MGLPKTIFFNFKYLKFRDAIKLPVIISHKVVLAETNGSIAIESPVKTGMIRMGFGGVRIFDKKYSRSIWHVEGKVTFKGRTRLGYGTRLSIFGDITFGNNFSISAQSQIECKKKITFGDDVLIGWDCLFMDADNHHILDKTGNIANPPKEIVVGNRVWFGARCVVIKGVIIGNDVVVAINSCIYGKFEDSNCVIGGNPPRILKKGIIWKV